MKVFGVGFIKTGTSTLGAALERLGYNHRHGSSHVGNELLPAYLRGQKDIIRDFVDQYDSFDDFPFCAPGMPKLLDEMYPDSKFILTIREADSWFGSLVRYFRPKSGGPTNLNSQRGACGLPLGPNYGLLNYLLTTFGTIDVEGNREHYIKRYQEYNRGIIDHFRSRPGKLLTICFMDGQGWETLCPFLGKPRPKHQPFPRVNSNPRKK